MRPTFRVDRPVRTVTLDSTDPDRAPDSRKVLVGGRFLVPRAFTGYFKREDWTFLAEVRIAIVGGQPKVVGVRVHPARRSLGFSPRPGVATDERRLVAYQREVASLGQFHEVGPAELRVLAKALEEEVRDLLAWMATPLVEDQDGAWKSAKDYRETRRAIGDERARRKLTRQHLQAVADAYRRDPSAPRANVAATFGVPAATASRWIKEARVQGLLGAAPAAGKAGEVKR